MTLDLTTMLLVIFGSQVLIMAYTVVMTIVFFRYGSSADSRAKDAVIAGRVPVTPLPTVKPLSLPVKPTVPPLAAPTIHTKTLVGKMSTFGGPQDSGVSPSEGLALVERSEMHKFPGMFLAAQPAGTDGLSRWPNPAAYYCACK